jgi:hypothetical protein
MLQGRTRAGRSDSLGQILSGGGIPLIPQAVNRLFAILRVGSGMARIFILLALAAITYTVILPGTPGGGGALDPSAAGAVAPAAIGLPGLDLLSLAIGLVVGLVIGWVWHLPWRTMSELSRELFLRSVLGVGLVGLAMGAAAILLFY